MDVIQLENVIHEGESFFKIVGAAKEILVNKIPAVLFEGYTRRSKCRIKRNGEIIGEGYVMYYGTHAASEYFFGSSGSFGKCSPSIAAADLQAGDLLEIENKKAEKESEGCRFYDDVDDFAGQLIDFVAIAKALNEGFAAHDNALSKEQIFQEVIPDSTQKAAHINEEEKIVLRF